MSVLLLIGAAVLAALVLWVRRRTVVVTVSGRSMEPTLRAGDRVLVRRTPAASVRRGDIVLLHLTNPSGLPAAGMRPGWFAPVVKRVAAAPGDVVPPEFATGGVTPGTPVPPGHLLLVGDNTALSHDSRTAGFYPADRIVGTVRRTLAR